MQPEWIEAREDLRLTEDGDTRICEDGQARILEFVDPWSPEALPGGSWTEQSPGASPWTVQ